MSTPVAPSVAVPPERKLKDQAEGLASAAASMRRAADNLKNRMPIADRAAAADHFREAEREAGAAARIMDGAPP